MRGLSISRAVHLSWARDLCVGKWGKVFDNKEWRLRKSLSRAPLGSPSHFHRYMGTKLSTRNSQESWPGRHPVRMEAFLRTGRVYTGQNKDESESSEGVHVCIREKRWERNVFPHFHFRLLLPGIIGYLINGLREIGPQIVRKGEEKGVREKLNRPFFSRRFLFR